MDSDLKDKMRDKVKQLAQSRGVKVTTVADDVLLLHAGLLDSAGVLELIVWLETMFDTELDLGELTIENFGSIARMAQFLSNVPPAR